MKSNLDQIRDLLSGKADAETRKRFQEQLQDRDSDMSLLCEGLRLAAEDTSVIGTPLPTPSATVPAPVRTTTVFRPPFWRWAAFCSLLFVVAATVVSYLIVSQQERESSLRNELLEARSQEDALKKDRDRMMRQ